MGARSKLAKVFEKPITAYMVCSFMLIVMLSPIVFTALTSFKTREETFRWPPTYFPENPTLGAYHEILFESPMGRHLLNSLIIALGTTATVLVMGVFTAYGLSQYRFRGSKWVMVTLLATRIIPPISLLPSFYMIFSYLGLINTYTGLIVLNTFLIYPLAVWMLKSFFDAFPRDLIDAALVDGCGRTRAFIRVVLPVSTIGIAAVAIISFLWAWNEFLFAMIFSNTREVQPATVGAHYFIGDETIQWDSLAATAIFTALPGIIFFTIAQKAIIKGLTAGGVKG